MFAILVMMGTRHACNIVHIGDQICLQYQLRWGLDLPAMSVIKGTKYACNIDNKGDQTCLQYQLRWGLDMLAIFSNGDQICLQSLKIFKFISSQPGSLPVKSDWRKRCVIKMRILWSSKIGPKVNLFQGKDVSKFSKIASISGPHQKRLQAYLVLNVTDIESMSSPL